MRVLDSEYKLRQNIKIAMLYLEDDDSINAELFIKKASSLIAASKVWSQTHLLHNVIGSAAPMSVQPGIITVYVGALSGQYIALQNLFMLQASYENTPHFVRDQRPLFLLCRMRSLSCSTRPVMPAYWMQSANSWRLPRDTTSFHKSATGK